MEEDLPADLIKNLQEKTQQMKHNWMYSFMPGSEGVYLVGYCKVCDNAVTSRVSSNDMALGYAEVVKANIPKWGCIPDQVIAEEF